MVICVCDPDPFQSTRPMRGATTNVTGSWQTAIFQSTRPMRGATAHGVKAGHFGDISIHAPHAGRDRSGRWPRRCRKNFNPRAPCGARLGRAQPGDVAIHISIHAPHAGRDFLKSGGKTRKNISIHAPHAGRDGAGCAERRMRRISIHAPHAGRDTGDKLNVLVVDTFQSTRPMRGATKMRACIIPSTVFQSTRPMRGATPKHRPPRF